MSKIHVIIPAAGSGSRLGDKIPKQFARIENRTVIEYIEGIFSRVSLIDSISIALHPDEKFISSGNCQFSNKTKVLYCGGQTRSQTVFNALCNIHDTKDDDWILVHDAARIGITESIINQFITEMSTDKVGGIVAIPVPDTVKKVNKYLEVVATENREFLWLAQTPQMFKCKTLKHAIQSFDGSPTDEAEAVEAIGLQPKIFEGSALNFKITYPEDLYRAQSAINIIKKGAL